MKRVLSILLFVLLPAVATAQIVVGGSAGSLEQSLRKFNQFYYYLDALYVDTINHQSITEEAIRAVLSELDPHSAYVTAEEMEEVEEEFSGSFSGVGIEFDILNDTLTVVATIAGGPSEQLGVLAGDKIVKIDSESAIGITQNDVRKRLRGPKGSVVELEVVRRLAAEPLHFRITRDDIPIETIDAAYTIAPGIGYVKVNRFAETTMDELRAAVAATGATEGLILDLRGNSGGLLTQAVEMGSYFLPAGCEVVSIEGRSVPRSRYGSEESGEWSEGRLVVLTDSSSASASEIVAGAVQDWDRGVIVGQPTYGKGLVQRQIPMADGSAVRITIAHYYTPSGRAIQRPYENGKSDEYYIDHLRRAVDESYRDSVNQNLPAFKTLLNERTVYGGGGIEPDLYIPIDTTRDFSYWSALVGAGVVNELINIYLDEERAQLERRYPSFDNFSAEYQLPADMQQRLIDLGEKHGVTHDPRRVGNSLSDTGYLLKALVARKLWGTTEYYRVVHSNDDPELKAALELIGSEERYRDMLNPRQEE